MILFAVCRLPRYKTLPLISLSVITAGLFVNAGGNVTVTLFTGGKVGFGV